MFNYTTNATQYSFGEIMEDGLLRKMPSITSKLRVKADPITWLKESIFIRHEKAKGSHFVFTVHYDDGSKLEYHYR